MDKSDARRILRLDENATLRQVEARYNNLSRRVKNGEELDFENIQKAYELLMGYEKYDDNAGKLKLAYRKFMFSYKGWAILVTFSLIVIALIFVPMIFRRIPDLTVSFAGRYGSVDPDVMAEVLMEQMPDTEDVLVEVIYLDDEGKSGEFDSGGRTRLTGLLISEDADILIVDDGTFNFIRSDNVLMPLDDLIDSLGIDIPEDRYIYGIDFESGEKMVFGISVADDYLIYRTVYGEARRILTVARKTGHLEDVKKAIEVIISYRSD
jgi:hypothetical protein